MRNFRVLPHTADTRLSVTSDSLEDLFKGALEGMSEIVKRGVTKSRSNSSFTIRVELSSIDATALLIDFLNYILTKDIIERAVFYDALELEVKGNRVLASVSGVAVDSFDEDIKAVTYHGAQIQNDRDGNFTVELVFDV